MRNGRCRIFNIGNFFVGGCYFKDNLFFIFYLFGWKCVKNIVKYKIVVYCSF